MMRPHRPHIDHVVRLPLCETLFLIWLVLERTANGRQRLYRSRGTRVCADLAARPYNKARNSNMFGNNNGQFIAGVQGGAERTISLLKAG